jgi:hypothetical protein
MKILLLNYNLINMLENIFTILSEKLSFYFKNNIGDYFEEPIVFEKQKEDAVNVHFVSLQQENLYASHQNKNRPIQLNILLLFSCNFTSNVIDRFIYLEAILQYFQSTPAFTPENTPNLDERISKLSFEIINLNVSEINQLFSMLDSKHRPFVVYKLRIITIDNNNNNNKHSLIKGFKN